MDAVSDTTPTVRPTPTTWAMYQAALDRYQQEVRHLYPRTIRV